MQWPAAWIEDLRAFWLKYPFGPMAERLEDAAQRATIKNCLTPRKGRPWTVDELLFTHRRPPTDDELNLKIRKAFGWPGSLSQAC